MNKDWYKPYITLFRPTWIGQVRPHHLKYDFIAGITVAVMLLTQGVAFAIIAGLPPAMGLYTCIVATLVGAFFGSSKHLSTGPNTPLSIIAFAAISQFAEPGSIDYINQMIILTMMVGVAQLVLGLVNMGALVNFVSHSVVVGFISGAAILIGAKQLKHVLGITVARGATIPEIGETIFRNYGAINYTVLLIAVVTLVIGIVLRKINKKIPSILIALLMGSVLAFFLDNGTSKIVYVEKISSQLPQLSWPSFSLADLSKFSTQAMAIAILGLTQSVSISKSIASDSGQKIDGNKEFIGQGMSNIVSGLFSGYLAGGSFTRSAINYQSGAKTPMASIFAALMMMAMLVYLAPLSAYIPMPALAGVILLSALQLINIGQIRKLLKSSKMEGAVMMVTFLSTLFLDLEFAIYMGVICSLFFYLRRTSQPKVVAVAPVWDTPNRSFANVERLHLDECPQLKTIRIDGSLYFGAVDFITTELLEIRKTDKKYLLIIASGINYIDLSGAELLAKEAVYYRELGGGLYLTGLKNNARHYLERGEYIKQIGEEHIFTSKKYAIRSIFQSLDKDICSKCQLKIFKECRTEDLKVMP